jgi:hypothetical protein
VLEIWNNRKYESQIPFNYHHLSTTTSDIPQSTIDAKHCVTRSGDTTGINYILSPPSDATLASIVYLYSYSGMLKDVLNAFPSTDALTFGMTCTKFSF